MKKVIIGVLVFVSILIGWFGWTHYSFEKELELSQTKLDNYLKSRSTVRSFIDDMTDERTDVLEYQSETTMNVSWLLLPQQEKIKTLLAGDSYNFIENPWSLTISKKCNEEFPKILVYDSRNKREGLVDMATLQMRVNKEVAKEYEITFVSGGLYDIQERVQVDMIKHLQKNGTVIFSGLSGVSPKFDLKDFSMKYQAMCQNKISK